MSTELTIRSAFRHLAVFLAWNVALGLLLIFAGVIAGAVLAAALSAWLLWGYVLYPRARSWRRRWTMLRIRSIPPRARPWVAAAVPVLLILSWSLGEVYMRLVPVPAEQLDPFGELFRTPIQRLVLALLAIVAAPLLEEFFFRGLIQRPFEERWGAGWGILAASALFALVHGLLWVFPIYLVLGAAFGWVVYATRSIWAGVMLHAANNSVAMIGLASQPDPLPTTTTVWEAGPTPELGIALLLLVGSAAAGVWVARGMRVATPARAE